MQTPRINRARVALIVGILAFAILGVVTMNPLSADSWRDGYQRATLKNSALEACFQAGLLYQLKDVPTGKLLVSFDPQKFPSQLMIFDQTLSNLDGAVVTAKTTRSSVATTYKFADGNLLTLKWSIQPGKGDLVLQTTTKTIKPIEQLRYTIFGCDIVDRALVWISGYGAGNVMRAPWTSSQIGDPQKDGAPGAYPHPVVALFQGEKSGWWIEGRDPRPGPANLLAKGNGDNVDLGLVRRFPIAKQDPDLYEIRIRTYKDHWEDAVDPYTNWLEKGAGFIPIAKLPKERAWVKDILTQAYVQVGNYKILDQLAKRVDPKKVFIGRQSEHRPYAFDVGYPDYRLTPEAKKWVKYVRDLGYHVGVHYNSNAISTDFPELVDKFRPGFSVIGKDANGNDTYESLYNGKLIRVSPAFKPWREYLIAQMKDAVDAGVDVIYLDESMTAVGKYIVDGVDGMQGMLALMRETLEAYPHCVVENEQFNLLTAKYGKFALSQMPLGHPLSGYLFQKFVKVVPEGVMYSPTDTQLMDAFDYYGYMLPGADPMREESWVQIIEAYHKYGLVADGRLPRKQITDFTSHWSHGVVPVDNDPIPADGEKLFGLRGKNGVTAFFEKRPNERGLVVYEPGKEPKMVGIRRFGIKSFKGPGVPAYFGYRQFMRDWLLYNDDTILGLNPKTSYFFDETIKRSPTRFHVSKVPDDFIGYDDMDRRIAPYEIGKDESFYRLAFGGHGQIEVYVPDEYDAYLDGKKLEVDPLTKKATATINASLPKTGTVSYFIALTGEGKPLADTGERPSMLLAFKRTDAELAGNWTSLPWQGSKDNLKFVAVGDGPVLTPANTAANFPGQYLPGDGAKGSDLTMNIGGYAIFIGKLPAAKSIRLEGSYKVNTETGAPGDGVVLINGKQVMRVGAGEYPYTTKHFTADISAYSGQYVLMEVIPDGSVRGASATWTSPRIVVAD